MIPLPARHMETGIGAGGGVSPPCSLSRRGRPVSRQAGRPLHHGKKDAGVPSSCAPACFPARPFRLPSGGRAAPPWRKSMTIVAIDFAEAGFFARPCAEGAGGHPTTTRPRHARENPFNGRSTATRERHHG
jgi:hypothetical protein